MTKFCKQQSSIFNFVLSSSFVPQGFLGKPLAVCVSCSAGVPDLLVTFGPAHVGSSTGDIIGSLAGETRTSCLMWRYFTVSGTIPVGDVASSVPKNRADINHFKISDIFVMINLYNVEDCPYFVPQGTVAESQDVIIGRSPTLTGQKMGLGAPCRQDRRRKPQAVCPKEP